MIIDVPVQIAGREPVLCPVTMVTPGNYQEITAAFGQTSPGVFSAPDTRRCEPDVTVNRGANFYGDLEEEYFVVPDRGWSPSRFFLWRGDSPDQEQDDVARLCVAGWVDEAVLPDVAELLEGWETGGLALARGVLFYAHLRFIEQCWGEGWIVNDCTISSQDEWIDFDAVLEAVRRKQPLVIEGQPASDAAAADTSSTRHPFICPECLSETPGTTLMVSPDFSVKRGERTPWHNVLQIIECAGCSMSIPAHLGERWGGINVEEAREDWEKTFRPTRWDSED